MHPSHFFSSSNVLIVAGKGGVGKTVTAAAVATEAEVAMAAAAEVTAAEAAITLVGYTLRIGMLN